MFRILSTLSVVIFCQVAEGADWQYAVKVDRFTDAKVHTGSITADSGEGFGVIRCDESKKLEIFFSVGEFIGSEGQFPIRYRIDKHDVVPDKWGVSTQGTSVFVGAIEKAPFARKLADGASNLLLEIKDYRGTAHQAKFSLQDSNDVISKVLEACGTSRNKFEIAGVSDSIIDRLELYGPKFVVCQKKMLTTLGYSISDESSEKTSDLYLAMQAYLDDKLAKCPTTSDRIYKMNCDRPDGFLYEVYGDAIGRKPSLRQQCGSLKIGD